MVESSAQTDSVLEQLPMRVSVSVPNCDFLITEYSLPHEETQVNVAQQLNMQEMASIW